MRLPEFAGFSYWLALLNQGDPRSVAVKRNVLLSLTFRLVSIVSGLMLVPLCLSYLDLASYGIWVTLSSVMGWVTFFDIGLGNGLRNRLAEALARKDTTLARTYVSTGYAILAAIAAALVFFYAILSPMLPWASILKAPQQSADDLSLLAFVVFAFVSIRFVVGLIGMVLTADQKPALNSGLDAVASVLSLVFVFFLSRKNSNSLILLGSGLSLISVLVPFAASVYLYDVRYRYLAPTWSAIDMRRGRDLATLGARFFVLQAVFVIVFATDNLIITHILSPEDVVPYSIAFKYFGLLSMFFSLLTSPLWSAFTDAYVKNDTQWIRDTVKTVSRVWALVAALAIVMLLVSPTVYHIWVGTRVKIPPGLSIAMCIFVLVTTWNTVFTTFVNGVGKIRVQTIFAVAVGVANIPLSIIFAKYLGMGSTGVMIGTVVCILPGAIITPIQYRRIINDTARDLE